MKDAWGNKISKKEEHKWNEFDCSAAVDFALKGYAEVLAEKIKAQLEKNEGKES